MLNHVSAQIVACRISHDVAVPKDVATRELFLKAVRSSSQPRNEEAITRFRRTPGNQTRFLEVRILLGRKGDRPLDARFLNLVFARADLSYCDSPFAGHRPYNAGHDGKRRSKNLIIVYQIDTIMQHILEFAQKYGLFTISQNGPTIS